MAMQLTPESVTQIASAISAPLSGAADRPRYTAGKYRASVDHFILLLP
jgi:hypothetical protein